MSILSLASLHKETEKNLANSTMTENQEVVEIKPGMEKLAENEGEEKKIPVFTVLKNNAILKNIFLVDCPPPGPASLSNLVENESSVTDKQELEQILVVGRHPDCNITLEHPSISRFHLRIHSIPSKQSLSVLDLSSVHGTWVCGKKIASGVRVELDDGDILQLGGSSRIYRLHWIPLSHAYDLDNPFVPMVEESETMEEKEETPRDSEGPYLQHDDQIQMEADMNIMSQTKQLTPSAPPMPEDMKSQFPYEDEAENKADYSDSSYLMTVWEQDEEELFLQHDQIQTAFDDLNGLDLLFPDMFAIPETALATSASLKHDDMEPQLSCKEEAETNNSYYISEIAGLQPVWQLQTENSIPDAAVASGKSQHETSESSTSKPQLSSDMMSIWKRRGKSASVSVSVQTSRVGESSNKTSVNCELKSESRENLSTELIPEDPFASEDTDKEVFTPDKENCASDSLLYRSFKKFYQEEKEHKLSGHSITSFMGEDKEEVFTPDKENITPNTLLLRSLKKLEKLGGIGCPNTYRSSPLKNVSSKVLQKVDKLGSSNQENHVKKLVQEKKPWKSASRIQARSDAETIVLLKGKADRVPFQSLLASPNHTGPEKSTLKASSYNLINNQQIKESIHPFHKNPLEILNKKWTMVVDAACLLNKESRKVLQLMQGLQGTSLIIPSIVIRELDCMKRRNNLFRRKTEVCSALEWIEECMVNAQSWIHVQSSMEDARPLATTPPASPLCRDVEKTWKFSINSVPFSPCGSWLDIVSPTTEDHILECALFFRRIKNNNRHHLVLLSNNVTLKIKAMAEGLLCETAEEFRQSLVNPFSERFLWTDSSPRGPTWSCIDDIVLKEKYYNNPMQKQPRSGEGVKGLKLILHHNSHFRQISSVR